MTNVRITLRCDKWETNKSHTTTLNKYLKKWNTSTVHDLCWSGDKLPSESSNFSSVEPVDIFFFNTGRMLRSNIRRQWANPSLSLQFSAYQYVPFCFPVSIHIFVFFFLLFSIFPCVASPCSSPYHLYHHLSFRLFLLLPLHLHILSLHFHIHYFFIFLPLNTFPSSSPSVCSSTPVCVVVYLPVFVSWSRVGSQQQIWSLPLIILPRGPCFKISCKYCNWPITAFVRHNLFYLEILNWYS